MSDLSKFKAPLIYWARQTSQLNGFFIGKKYKAPTTEDYFTIEFISTNRRSRSFRSYNSTTELWDSYYYAELTYRLNVYGEGCESIINNMENSLYGDEVPQYLSSHGLSFAKSSNIKTSNDFNITEFLPQSQVDLTFNVLLSTYEDMGFINEANFSIEEQ